MAPTSPIPTEAARPAPRHDLSGTSTALELPLRSALPFPAAQASPVPVAAPPTGAPGGGRPTLTLEQHASLCCEFAEAPERAMEALARYRVTPAEKLAADQHYAARFASQPGVRTAWDAAYATYRAWWLAGRVSR